MSEGGWTATAPVPEDVVLAPPAPAVPADRSAYERALAEVSAEFVQDVADDVEKQHRYVSRQMRKYRIARVVAIVAAGLVPVLATVPAIGKVWLGALGALAVVAESVIQLYRWRDAALAAMQLGNALHVHLDLYRTRSAPYDTETGQARFSRFAAAITSIRRGAADAFAGIWAEDRPPSAAPGPETGGKSG